MDVNKQLNTMFNLKSESYKIEDEIKNEGFKVEMIDTGSLEPSKELDVSLDSNIKEND